MRRRVIVEPRTRRHQRQDLKRLSKLVQTTIQRTAATTLAEPEPSCEAPEAKRHRPAEEVEARHEAEPDHGSTRR